MPKITVQDSGCRPNTVVVAQIQWFFPYFAILPYLDLSGYEILFPIPRTPPTDIRQQLSRRPRREPDTLRSFIIGPHPDMEPIVSLWRWPDFWPTIEPPAYCPGLASWSPHHTRPNSSSMEIPAFGSFVVKHTVPSVWATFWRL